MARKSHGFRIKTRGKLTKDVRTRGKVPVSRILQEFYVETQYTLFWNHLSIRVCLSQAS